jgi:hypothetical protein
MEERRKVQRRRYRAHTQFPANDHMGNIIMSERRLLTTRRAYDLWSFSKQIYAKPVNI